MLSLFIQCGKEKDKKAVFIVSTLLEGVTREILCDILQASHFQVRKNLIVWLIQLLTDTKEGFSPYLTRKKC